MKSPGPSGHRSFIAGILASALSITSRLMRHNWRRGGIRPDGSRQRRSAGRKWSENQAATQGNPVIVLALLVVLAMLANRETLPLSSLGCIGMYNVTREQSSLTGMTCHSAPDNTIDLIKSILKEKWDFNGDNFSDLDLNDLEEMLFEDVFDPSSDDLL